MTKQQQQRHCRMRRVPIPDVEVWRPCYEESHGFRPDGPDVVCEAVLYAAYARFKQLFLHAMMRAGLFPLDDHGRVITHKAAYYRDLLSFLILRNLQQQGTTTAAADNPFFFDRPRFDVADVRSLVQSEFDASGRARLQAVLRHMEKLSVVAHAAYAESEERLRSLPRRLELWRLRNDGNFRVRLWIMSMNDDDDEARDRTRTRVLHEHEVELTSETLAKLRADYVGDDNDDDEQSFLGKVFVLLLRYRAFDSGNNQSSVPSELKAALRERLGVRVELFGSALNSESGRFGSLFYDVERYFGSMGDFFRLSVRSGCFEVNPPYENALIDDVFAKLAAWLHDPAAGPLLFFVVLPKRDYSTFRSYAGFSRFVRRSELVHKKRIPFVRFDRDLVRRNVSSIVDVVVIIAHNSQISDDIAKNVRRWDTAAAISATEKETSRRLLDDRMMSAQ